MIRFGEYELDPDVRDLRRKGRRVRLPPQAFRLLVTLVSVPGEVVSRDQLRAALWPEIIQATSRRCRGLATASSHRYSSRLTRPCPPRSRLPWGRLRWGERRASAC